MRYRAFLLASVAIGIEVGSASAQSDAGPPPRDSGLSCLSSDDCTYPTPYCGTTHACVECLSDQNCGSRGYCNPLGNCVQCLNDSQCDPYLPYCDDTLGTCVECRSDKNCGNSGVRCLSGQCGTCGDRVCSRLEQLTGCSDCGCLDPFFCYDGGFGGNGGFYDAGPVSYCGDGYADPGEECDGFDLGYYDTCNLATSGALPSGVLACTPFCTYDVSGCRGAPTGFGGFGGTFGRDAGAHRDSGSSLARRCVPGQQVRCACPVGDGVQTCASDAQSYGPCRCSAPDGGAPQPEPRGIDAGASGRPGASDAGSGARSTSTSGGCGCELGRSETASSLFGIAALAALSLVRRSRRR